MKLTELFLEELDRESAITRRTLGRVPVNQEGLDFAPKGGSGYKPEELRTSGELVAALATVYLRLNGAHVPSIYGPTADEPIPAAGTGS